MSSEYDHLFKVLLVGDSGVGKTSLLFRFVDDTYTESSINTVGVDFKTRGFPLGGKTVKLQIWDTAVPLQNKKNLFMTSAYRASAGIAVVFDVTSEQSFQNVKNWMADIDENTKEDVRVVLIGNKNDAEARMVDPKVAQAFADECNIPYIETSAKKGSNVQEAMTSLTANMLSDTPPKRVKLGAKGDEPKDKGCVCY